LIEVASAGNEKIAKYSKKMKDSAHRMAQLTGQLLAYAKGGKYQVEPISINDFLEKTIPIMRHNINPDISIETDLTTGTLIINADQT
jgi:C4-dicarboxylate-specific signal transduction histidine kinase